MLLHTPHVEVPRIEYEKLTDKREGERSADVRARVIAARTVQSQRFASLPRVTCNAEMGPAEVRKYCELDSAAQPLLRAATQRLQLSARAFHRVLKLARTIADLAACDTIAAPHLAEALQYRPRVEAG
jgi:magnesium chelatase family protein